MTTATSQNLPLRSYPRFSEVMALIAPFLWGLVVTFLLLPFCRHSHSLASF